MTCTGIWRVILENFEMLQDGIVDKYHVQVMLLFVYKEADREMHKRTSCRYGSKNKPRRLH